MTRPHMLDLFTGLGGAHKGFLDNGWLVTSVDIDQTMRPDIVADLSRWSWDGPHVDFIWASPPCTEFSRESMPWCRTGNMPDLTLVNAARRIISECRPDYWIVENVRGAVPYLGKPRTIVGPFYLWGMFPDLGHINTKAWRKKESYGSKQRAERAMIPYELSKAVADAVSIQAVLL